MSYLGIDIGTSQIKAIAFDKEFNELARSNLVYERITPRPGWYEISAREISEAVRTVVRDCSQHCKSDPVASVSFSVFGGGILAVDSRLEPLTDIISTTDARAHQETDFWIKNFGRQKTYQITGTTVHSSLMLPKIMWIRNNLGDPGRIHKFITASELALISLGVEPRMDHATASTTMMFDIRKRKWSDEILSFAKIAEEEIPLPVPSGDVIGELPKKLCEDLGVKYGCRVVAGGHDQQVCAFGAGLIDTGEATDSLGTVECITTLFNEPVFREDLLDNNISNLLHVYGGKIASFVYNFSSGDLLKWYREQFCEGNISFDEMFAKLPSGPSAVFVLPHFCGSGTPYLDVRSKGAFLGLSLQTDRFDILRGIIDSQNYEMRLNLEIWKRNSIRFNTLKAYGKGSSSDAVLKIKSDILNMEIRKLDVVETGCLGAALLAARGADYSFNTKDILKKAVKVKKVFQPEKRLASVYDEKFEIYKDLYPSIKNISHRI